ncbi:MAG: hypothetical protein FJY65_02120 [Calditrichaeota bacterium]|nr:hypothetical protein [Calditrichota bacterium]
MQNTKDEVMDIIRNLPDDAEYEDAIEALCLRMTAEERLRDLDAGIYVEHSEARQRLLQD